MTLVPRACLRDLPDAELHLLDAGHWAPETGLDEIVPLVRDFLGRVHPCGEHRHAGSRHEWRLPYWAARLRM